MAFAQPITVSVDGVLSSDALGQVSNVALGVNATLPAASSHVGERVVFVPAPTSSSSVGTTGTDTIVDAETTYSTATTIERLSNGEICYLAVQDSTLAGGYGWRTIYEPPAVRDARYQALDAMAAASAAPTNRTLNVHAAQLKSQLAIALGLRSTAAQYWTTGADGVRR